jgi:metal-dependent HD superfamily phosphatase/phosphodiesterase
MFIKTHKIIVRVTGLLPIIAPISVSREKHRVFYSAKLAISNIKNMLINFYPNMGFKAVLLRITFT